MAWNIPICLPLPIWGRSCFPAKMRPQTHTHTQARALGPRLRMQPTPYARRHTHELVLRWMGREPTHRRTRLDTSAPSGWSTENISSKYQPLPGYFYWLYTSECQKQRKEKSADQKRKSENVPGPDTDVSQDLCVGSFRWSEIEAE